MKTYSFLDRQLSANQRQSMELRKRLEQADLQAKQTFNQTVKTTIDQVTNLSAIEDYYKFRLSPAEGFTSTPCLCQVLDSEELHTYRDHTRGYY